MKEIKVVSLDPALANFGICQAMVNPITGQFRISDLTLVKTSSNPDGKRSTDDFRRCRDISNVLKKALEGSAWCVAEVPQIGGKMMQARSIWTSGMMFGLLAGMDIELIEVTPIEVKLAATDRKDATKDDMIQWAVEKFPEAAWLRKTIKGETTLIKDNEHLADAVGVLNAGLRKPVLVQAMNALKFYAEAGNG